MTFHINKYRKVKMNNSIIVPEDKDFVCAFATSPNSFYEAIESYRNYVDLVQEIEFEHVFLYLLFSIVVNGSTDITINDEVRMCIEQLVYEKKSIRNNNADKKM